MFKDLVHPNCLDRISPLGKSIGSDSSQPAARPEPPSIDHLLVFTLFIVLGLGPACGSKSQGNVHLDCAQSVSQACPVEAPTCDRTWGDVLSDVAYCGIPLGPTDQFYVVECGDYHVLVRKEDSGTTYYYYDVSSNVSSEVLTAAVGPNEVGAPRCIFGPPGGITPPDCPNAQFQTSSAWCGGDGGADSSSD
jgi:hypothetical protein